MNIEFKKAVEKKKILKFAQGKRLVKKELREAEDDLTEALNRFKSRKYKYATVTGYYSMFHSARALMYSKGYREKSHYYLLVALNSLFVNAGLLSEGIASGFHDGQFIVIGGWVSLDMTYERESCKKFGPISPFQQVLIL